MKSIDIFESRLKPTCVKYTSEKFRLMFDGSKENLKVETLYKATKTEH